MNAGTLFPGILSFGNASGYEIRKMVEDGMFKHFVGLDPSLESRESCDMKAAE